MEPGVGGAGVTDFPTKQCLRCLQVKPTHQFGFMGKSGTCYQCAHPSCGIEVQFIEPRRRLPAPRRGE